jgi:hypothetical protein
LALLLLLLLLHHHRFFLLVYSSLEEFLGTNFDFNSRRNEQVLRPSYLPMLRRQGLDDCIKKAWENILTSTALTERTPLLFVHSSPGCGKVSLCLYLY